MNTDFQTMTKIELRDYLLKHREDQQAFYAYMDKLANEPILAVHSLSDSKPLGDVITEVRKENF